MSLAHYVSNKGLDPNVAIHRMKSKRNVVMVGVQYYDGIQQLLNEQIANEQTNR